MKVMMGGEIKDIIGDTKSSLNGNLPLKLYGAIGNRVIEKAIKEENYKELFTFFSVFSL